MKNYNWLLILFFAFAISFVPIKDAASGPGTAKWLTIPQTDSFFPSTEQPLPQFYVFDLRDRETFIQFSYQDAFERGIALRAHVQIFDVSNNCNENNFFDIYTINDTHTYNLRDIVTNDGNPSGVILPDNSYGIVVISYTGVNGEITPLGGFGNLRIIDDNGYEYRTNAQQLFFSFPIEPGNNIFEPEYTFNFNSEDGIILSDIVGLTLSIPEVEGPDLDFFEWDAASVTSVFSPFDIDIYDLNEVPFSCRDVTFACVDQNHPLLEDLLEVSGTNVASFEYGINDAIPHSKGGELLCPGNIINNGIVTLKPEIFFIEEAGGIPNFFGFVGLNNGNARGTMDSMWVFNVCQFEGDGCNNGD